MTNPPRVAVIPEEIQEYFRSMAERAGERNSRRRRLQRLIADFLNDLLDEIEEEGIDTINQSIVVSNTRTIGDKQVTITVRINLS
jgi:hypothetical protein